MDFTSPYPDLTPTSAPLTPFVLDAAARRPDHPALIDDETGEQVSFAELDLRVRKAAAAFAGLGVAPGDVVAIFAPNSIEYPVAFLGAAAIGAAVTTLNPTYTPREVASQLRDSRARLLLASPETEEKVDGSIDGTDVREVFVLGGDGGNALARLLDAAEPMATFPDVDPDTLAALPYSSGTTGTSKGVMLTHRNLVANIEQVIATGLCRPDEVGLGLLPFFHIYGMVAVLFVSLRRGATLVVHRRYDLERLLASIARNRITLASLVPPILLSFAKDDRIEEHDLSSLERILSGAAPLSPAIARACERRVGSTVHQGYGLTETSPVTHVNPVGRPDDKIGASGTLVASTRCRVVDLESGAPLGPNERGEIWLHGPQVMRGYLERPDETADVLKDGGWLATGDIGFVDDDGYLYVVDRKKELIKFRGQQVAPAELEALLLKHPAIRDAAVVPQPDEEAGEVPKAFVVASKPLTEDDVMTFVAAQVAPHKKVRRVEFIDAIPKSASGKILRRELRDRG